MELRRRKVYRVAVAYVAVAFVIVEGADLIFPALLLPFWAYTLVVVLAIAGLPAALVLAWALEITPEGIRRTTPAAPTPAVRDSRGRIETPRPSDEGAAPAAPEGPARDSLPDSPPGAPARDPEEGSIAVLPFVNLSGDPRYDYFAYGMTDDIINSLCQLEQLRVIARTSAAAFEAGGGDVRDIGAALNVAHLLEGSIRSTGNRIRVTVQLVHVSDGLHLWSRRFDRVLEDVFAIQDEVSLAVTDHLRLHVVQGDLARLTKRHTDDIDAYHSYVLGRHFLEKVRESDIAQGIKHLERAIARDPGYAQALAAVSHGHFLLGFFSHRVPLHSFRQAKDHALRALALDDSLAEARSALGLVRAYLDRDWAGAESEFQRALRSNPSSASVRQWHAYVLVAVCDTGRAVEESCRSLELNPLSAESVGLMGWCLLRAHRHDEARKYLRRMLEYDTRAPVAHWLLGQIDMKEARFQQGIARIERAARLAPDDPMILSGLGWSHAVAGHGSDARRMLRRLDELSESRYVDRYYYAKIFAGLGDGDEAFRYLGEAVARREMGATTSAGDETLDGLRSDDRFVRHLEEIGLGALAPRSGRAVT